MPEAGTGAAPALRLCPSMRGCHEDADARVSFLSPETRKGAPCLLVLRWFIAAACVPSSHAWGDPLGSRLSARLDPVSLVYSPLRALWSPAFLVLSPSLDFVYLSRSRLQTLDRQIISFFGILQSTTRTRSPGVESKRIRTGAVPFRRVSSLFVGANPMDGC
ncbi:hypothetical protein K438DRAFT_194708 [Mycena galopus ATCC 62051]|nr:hypothetical protein K438DRAFT_194708 [Mycena galopus ATCC 62051]